MKLYTGIARYYFSVMCIILICFIGIVNVYANDSEDGFILIISSYNPETSQTASNISAFLDEYKSLGGRKSTIIESMNCKSFSDALLWKEQMKDILDKYSGANTPELIILLGQEAWASYISQDKEVVSKTPVVCGMVSSNAVILPEGDITLQNWKPESIDVFEDVKNFRIVAGYAYKYNVEKNIKLIKDFYPNTKHIAFVSDNSYGGVAMQAYVREEMVKFPELDLILLDGRQHSIYTIIEEIGKLPENTVMLLGTWRVDKNEGYFMRNATYAMKDANMKIPVFTLASLGLGHWALGGYVPSYRTVGKDMARQVLDFFDKKQQHKLKIEFVPNQYIFDINRLNEEGFSINKLPQGAVLINQKTSFYEQYKYEILGIIVAFSALLIGFLVAVYFYIRTKKLKDDLELSEIELIKAKEKAEEANRLKTAFLANMSHEIRTPLNAIVGFSNVLVMGESSEEEKKKYFDIIQTNSDLLLHLINDILDISRLEADRVRFVLEPCDIVGLCRVVVSTAEYARRTAAKFIFNPPLKAFELLTDIQRLQQVLINLLSNAAKFTTEGTITLDFKVDEKEGYVYFSVSDTGCGIPADKREVVFNRFEKLDEYAQGTGLGLPICRLTLEKLGGKIWIDPNYDAGTRFIVAHPLHPLKGDE